MSTTDTPTETEFPDLPTGWEWWSGERGENYYTRWFGTEYQMGGDLVGVHGMGGYEGEMYWDGMEHHVQIYPVTGTTPEGDPELGYACKHGEYDTEQEAANAVPDLIRELKEMGR